MSARGARSRKVQQKDIQNKEKRVARTGKAPSAIQGSHDAFIDWRMSPSIESSKYGLSRTPTRSSDNSRTTSHNLRLGRTTKSSVGPTLSVSDTTSSKGKEKTKFQANGKETRAPRGRGGGVPMKRAVTPSPMLLPFQDDFEHDQLPANHRTWSNFRVWENGDGATRPYGGFDYDEDMQDGSVFIYFKQEQMDEHHPVPSIRARLDVLQGSGSTWIKNALAYGQVDDDDVTVWDMTYDPERRRLSQGHSPTPPPSQWRMLSPTSPGGQSPPPLDIDGVSVDMTSQELQRFGTETAGDQSRHSDSCPPSRRHARRNPTHEIWFTAPSSIKTMQGQRLHHVAIRNFLAMLHGKPIVGADLFEMLSTLQPEIQVMYELDNGAQPQMTSRERSVQLITRYLSKHGLDDVRHSVKHALGILAWSEQDNTRWRQGYVESFVHLAGLMTPQLENSTSFKRLSIVTRRNLSLAGRTLQLHAMEAEEKLATFDFAEMWANAPKVASNPLYHSYEEFRHFLIAHYTRIYGIWPPVPDGTWLDRKLVHAMQADFGSLYDYIVDRDVFWNPREERATRKWEMAHRKNGSFRADFLELDITDTFVTFDAKHSYKHIPHPYPLLPKEVPKVSREKEKKSFFSALKKDKTRDNAKDAKAHLQLSIVFSDATNIEKNDVNFDGSTLIDKFEQFELTTDLKRISPREARLGRWVLLYGILQVLSTLSVDVHGLKHTKGVRHFLCSQLKRLPEWVTDGEPEHMEACQQRSWCWQRSWDPSPVQTAPAELEALSSAVRQDTAQQQQQQQQQVHPVPGPFPSPPPDRKLPLPPTPSPDGVSLVQNDIRRIGEKIDNLSRSTRSRPTDCLDHNPPRHDSLAYPHQSHAHKPFHADLSFRAPRTQSPGTNTHLAGYSFSTTEQEMQWPVPPGYTESAMTPPPRTSTTTTTTKTKPKAYNRDSTVLGEEFGKLYLSNMDKERDVHEMRSPRRAHAREQERRSRV
ncbi:hypothetical protein ACN47E_000211 [Coniothyrium glycines]